MSLTGTLSTAILLQGDIHRKKNRWKLRIHNTAGEDRHQAPDQTPPNTVLIADTALLIPPDLGEPEEITEHYLLKHLCIGIMLPRSGLVK